MSNQQTVINLIKAASGQANVLTIPRIFITLTGDIKSALFLSQCVYWSDKSKREDGFFYKDAHEWEEETGLSRREQEGARNKVRQFIETKLVRANGAPTLHYRVNFDAIADAISTFCEIHKKGKSQNGENDLHEKGKSDFDEKGKTLTETTQKIHNPLSMCSTEGGTKLHQLLSEEYSAKGRKAPSNYKTLAMKEKWLKNCEARLAPADLERAIRDALTVGIVALDRVIAYVAKWGTQSRPTYAGKNGKQSTAEVQSPQAKQDNTGGLYI